VGDDIVAALERLAPVGAEYRHEQTSHDDNDGE